MIVNEIGAGENVSLRPNQKLIRHYHQINMRSHFNREYGWQISGKLSPYCKFLKQKENVILKTKLPAFSRK